MQKELILNWEIWVTPRMILSLAQGFPQLGFQRELGGKALLHQDMTPTFCLCSQ